jgi:His/Glu/Gln/Arg/opine family amino acid ABC transporter permease subunit
MIVLSGLPMLLAGLRFTALVSLLSLLFSLILGLAVCLCRMSQVKALSFLAFIYIQVFRSLSLYVYILFVYFGLAAFLGINIRPIAAAVLSLTLLNSAYIAEIYRGAIASVDPGQREAAACIGMTRRKAFVYILFPQAFRVALPALVSQLIIIIKDSSIVGVIGVSDIMFVAIRKASLTYLHFELFTIVALVYIVIIFGLSQLASELEQRLRIPT